jgi:thiol-disulfide isomerase/thioredoxin
MITAGATVGGVIVLVGIIVAAFFLVGGKKDAAPAKAASAGLINQVTNVPAATLDQIGKGSILSGATPTATSGQPVLSADGKPVVFYYGAQFCPFCAAERWPLIVALSRFGTFSNLSQINSSEDNIPTFTFEGSTYTSKYVTFQPKEVEDQKGAPLDTLTAQQQQIVNQFDTQKSFPFISIANQTVITAAGLDPMSLQGKTQDQVATALQDPTSSLAKSIGGNANAITAAICKVTNNQPADVCSSAAVKAFNG